MHIYKERSDRGIGVGRSVSGRIIALRAPIEGVVGICGVESQLFLEQSVADRVVCIVIGSGAGVGDSTFPCELADITAHAQQAASHAVRNSERAWARVDWTVVSDPDRQALVRNAGQVRKAIGARARPKWVPVVRGRDRNHCA